MGGHGAVSFWRLWAWGSGVAQTSWGFPGPSLVPESGAGNSLQLLHDVQLRSSLCHQLTAFIIELVP